MLRVGFILELSPSWMGGVNYYKNLFQAIEDYSNDIEVMIFIGKNSTFGLQEFPSSMKVISTGLLTKWHPLWFSANVCRRVCGKDFITSWYMKNHNVKILSHNNSGLQYWHLRNIAWIPDFQHKYLTEFFTAKEIAARDANFANIVKTADSVILSSYDAEKDFHKFYPQYAHKARVLQFVPKLDLNSKCNFNKLREKYDLPKKFFFLPNQYWIHKNHKVVIEALNILRRRISNIFVVSTGYTEDYRVKQHFEIIQKYITAHHIQDNYRILGLLPYEDVQALGDNCIAYINPSLFEGWSTVVEEAKYRGKRIILSDIPVHQEQAPVFGKYFNPHDAKELADIMERVWNDKEPERDTEKLKKILEEKRKKFAEKYMNICMSYV